MIGTIESVKIKTDEDGFWLCVNTEEDVFYRFRLINPEALYDHVKGAIGPWLRERDEAQTAWAIDRAVFACDPDESVGYDISDPQHPDHHSVHADIWDVREGK